MSVAGWVRCAQCGRDKKPRGRSAPLAMNLCEPPDSFGSGRNGCPGYYEEPRPDCRWPGEETCGPGCSKDREPPWVTQ